VLRKNRRNRFCLRARQTALLISSNVIGKAVPRVAKPTADQRVGSSSANTT
jgi:hypothetical protein